MRIALILLGLFYLESVNAQTTNSSDIQIFHSFEEFAPILQKEDNKVHIINFWATWCRPCVEELPFFENLNQSEISDGLEVVLVSLDFIDNINKSLIPFISKNKLKSEVVLLADEKTNEWIDKVDGDWEGTIPATLIYNSESYLFIEDSFESYEELREVINQFIK